jgi:hypothetical protein
MNDKSDTHLSSTDSLVFDEDVPTVVASRYKLVRAVALAYDGDADLYNVVGLLPHCDWIIIVHQGDVTMSIPIPCVEPEDFIVGVRSLHMIFELVTRKGLNLPDIMREKFDDFLVLSI